MPEPAISTSRTRRAGRSAVLLAERYGDTRLAQLYIAVSSGTSLTAALRSLGTTETALLQDWRADLRDSSK